MPESPPVTNTTLPMKRLGIHFPFGKSFRHIPVGQCLQTHSLDSQRSKEKGGSCYSGLHLNEERKKVGRNKRSISGCKLLGNSAQSNPSSHGSFCIESKTIALASKSVDGSSSAA